MDNFDKIQELFETVKNDPSNFQAVRELSVALLDSGYNEEALKQLVYLVGIFPEDSRLYFNIGYTFEKLKMFQKAEYSYRKAIELKSDEPDYYYNLGYLLMRENRNTKEAVECFRKVLEKEPKDPNTYFNLGIIYLRGKVYETAIKCFRKAFVLNNYDTLALFYEGNAYQQMGNIEKAKEIYHKVIDYSPEYSWAYYNLGQIAWTEGRIDDAINYLEKTVSINPKDNLASKLLAQIYIKNQNYEKARAVIKNTLNENPYIADFYYFMAKTYPEEKEKQIEYLSKAMENSQNLTISSSQIRKELMKLKS